MLAGHLGYIATPAQGNKRPPGVVWCADNGCFSAPVPVIVAEDGAPTEVKTQPRVWNEDKWWQFLVDNAADADTCMFAVAPDVVGDGWRTLIRSRPYLREIQNLGYPVAYVAQDNCEKHPIPWHDFDALFIGGTTEFKLGPVARGLVTEANQRGKWTHMGRVNSERRYEYARAIGCDSADGTFLTFGPDTNLPKLLRWVRWRDQLSLF